MGNRLRHPGTPNIEHLWNATTAAALRKIARIGPTHLPETYYEDNLPAPATTFL